VEATLLPSNFDRLARLLRGQGDAPAVSATVSPTGRFELSLPRPGVYRILVRAPGAVPMLYAPLPLVADRELPPVALPAADVSRVEVVGSEGRPVPGALVIAEPGGGHDLWSRWGSDGWSPAERHGRTGEDGVVLLPRAPGELLDVRVRPYAADVTTFAGRQMENIRFVLPPRAAGRTTVAISEADGSPAAGALVQLHPSGVPLGFTDGEGRLRLSGGVGGESRFEAWSADGRRLATPRPQRAGDTWRLELLPGTPLRGSVVDREGRPVAGALVWSNRDPGRSVTSDGGGRFELAAPSWRPRSWFQVEARGFLAEAREIPPGRGMDMAPIVLRPAVGVAGRVTDGDGAPLPGAAVRVTADADATPHFRQDGAAGRAWTDPAGHFRVGGLAPGVSHRLRASAPGHAPLQRRVTPPGDGLHLVLAPPPGAFGRVVDGADQPIGGVEVALHGDPPAEPGAEEAVAESDAGGVFRFAATPVGTVTLTARGEGWAPLTVRGVTVVDGGDSPGGEGPVDLGTLTLVRGVRIEGRVIDPEGLPLAGARVEPRVDRRRRLAPAVTGVEPVATDASGRFSIADLVAGAVRDLTFRADGYLPRTMRAVRAPTEPLLEVVLRPAASVRGRVMDGDGRPIEAAKVSIDRSDDLPGVAQAEAAGPGGSANAVTDAEGRYVLEGLSAGSFEIRAWSPRHRASPWTPVAVASGAAMDLPDLVLLPGETLAGRVTTVGGEPVAEVRVIAGPRATRTGDDGAYRLEGLDPGTQTLLFRHPRYPAQQREVEIHAGDNRLDVAFEPGQTVAGRVLAGGRPVPGLRVRLEPEDVVRGIAAAARSDGDGHFRFEEVPDGRYAVGVEDPAFEVGAATASVVVAGEAVEGLRIDLVATATASGAILGLAEEDLLAVRVEARNGVRRRAGEVGHRGRYRVPGLGPGDWSLRAYLPDGRREARGHVAIAPGETEIDRDLEFPSGLTLMGRVTYRDEPLTGASLGVRHLGNGGERLTRTDHQGRFRLEGLAPGAHRLTIVEHGRSLVHNERLDLTGDRDVDVRIWSGRVAGRVTAAGDGGPVADALVTLGQVEGGAGGESGPEVSRHTVGTEAEGRFRFLRIAEGRYRVSVVRDGFAPYEGSLVMRAGTDVEGLDLALERSPGLVLVVRDGAGRPVPRVTVSFLDPIDGTSVLRVGASGNGAAANTGGVSTDAGMTISSAPPGEWRLVVEGPDGALAETSARVPGPPLRVALPPVGAVEVRVPALLGRATRASLTLRRVDGLAYRRLDPSSGRVMEGVEVFDGQGAVTGVPPGAWSLRLVSPGGRVFTGTATVTAGGVARVVLE